MTANEIARLSKSEVVGILVTFRVIGPVGFVQIATFPPPVLYERLTVLPDTRVVLSAIDESLVSVNVEMPLLVTPETEILGVPVSPVAVPVTLPVKLPLNVVAVATPVTVTPLGKLGAPDPDLSLIVLTFIWDISFDLFRYL